MTGVSVNTTVTGVAELESALRDLPDDVADELRQANRDIAQMLARRAATDARAQGAQGPILAPTVQAREGRTSLLSSVLAGGSRRIGRNQAPAYKLLFGSIFGARQSGPGALRQFRPHLGRGSYWFFRTVTVNRDEIADQWAGAVEAALRRFGREP